MVFLALEFEADNRRYAGQSGSPEVMGNLILAMGLLEDGKQALIDQAEVHRSGASNRRRFSRHRVSPPSRDG